MPCAFSPTVSSVGLSGQGPEPAEHLPAGGFFCALAGDGLAPAAPPTLLQCRHADLQRQARRSAVRRLAVGRCASIASSETVLGRMGVYARAPFGWLWRPYCEISG